MTNCERTETVLQMTVRRTSDEKFVWETLRRQGLRKTSSQIATSTIHKRGREGKLKISRRSPILSSLRSSDVLPLIPVTIGSGSKTLNTFALCDSGASLSFVDTSLMQTLNLTGQPVDLNVAGNHGTSDISSKRLRVNIGDQDGKVN